ncbi:MAG: class I SAM-dependent methyltransferase [Bacteroidia bacterium]|nr:class I SAM-dependent methyltransferase [Bacteroidia bacterium]
MTNYTSQSLIFLNEILNEINHRDKLHSKKIEANIQFVKSNFPNEFYELLGLVYQYYFKDNNNVGASKIAQDYLKMINDYRVDGLYFYKHGKYRCENQQMAFEKVYSNSEIMSYYMNALLISQVLWKHHFNIFIYFQKQLKTILNREAKLKVLDVGPGHGFFSYLVKKNFVNYQKMDLVDISETSLLMTKKIIGYEEDKIKYFNKDIFLFDEDSKYDFIVLGEILEHLDNPKEILNKLSQLLSEDGVVWITTPTNSPAIDHVFLFKNRQEVHSLVESSNLEIIDSQSFIAEDVDEKTADEKRITNLVGLFCRKKH